MLLIGAILLDQATKVCAGLFGAAGQMILEQENLNQGISFGLFSSVPNWIVMVITVSILVMLHKYFLMWWQKYPYTAVLFFAGGLSNIFDRLVVGGVRDWLPIPYTGLYNNFADWYIAIALILLVAREVWSGVIQKSSIEKA